MKNIRYNGYQGPRLSKQMQLKRVQAVLQWELTPLQRETVMAYYVHKKTIPQIAAARGVHKSSVSRMLKRAEEKLRRFLRY